nr:hypothetical protein [Tanacetum cinerariifolium]
MRTCSSSNLPAESSPNPTTFNPKRRNRRHSKQPFILEESPVDTMVDQRTMAELQRAARRWLEKEPPHSILTWKDIVSKFINELFPPSRTTNLRNEILNFQQQFNESFHKAWDRYKDLLCACPHHGFIELHQVDTFYNALNPADQDFLNSAAGGPLLERPKLTRAVNQQTSAVTTAMIAILKQFQATPPPAFVKAVEEICVTYGGAHLYYQCLATDGNTFPKLQDNIQGYVAATAVNYNQGYNQGNNFNQDQSYQAPTQQHQVVPLSELEKIKRMNEADMKAMQTQNNYVKNKLRNEMKNSIQASMSNQTNELKNMMASFFQMNTASTSGSGSLPSNTISNPKGELKAITTQSGIVLDGPFVPIPLPFINPKEDERVEETITDQDLAEYDIKVPPPLVQKPKPPSQRNFVVNQRDPLYPNISYPSRMHKQKQEEKDEEKLLELANTPLNENCPAVILKKLPEKLGDPGKFLISCGFSELKCKALADLARITRDVIVSVGKFTFPADFVIVDYERDLRVPLILGRPFLRTVRALIDVHGEEMILRDGDERLTLNMRHDTSSYSNQAQKESINMINIFNDSSKDFLDNFTTSSSPNHLLEEFADELALITFPPGNDDLPFDIEYDLKEIEYLLNHDPIKDMDSILEDSVDEDNLSDLNDNLVDTMPEMFTEEHTLDYSSLPLYDEYDDDLLKLSLTLNMFMMTLLTPRERKSKNKNVKKLAISHASLILEDFDPPLYELPFFKEVPGAETLFLFSYENEEKVFKRGILTSKGVHSSLIPELSHQGYKFSKSLKFLKVR